MFKWWHTHWCDLTKCHIATAVGLLSLLWITLHSIDWERAIYLLSINLDLVLSSCGTRFANPFVLGEGQRDSHALHFRTSYSACLGVYRPIIWLIFWSLYNIDLQNSSEGVTIKHLKQKLPLPYTSRKQVVLKSTTLYKQQSVNIIKWQNLSLQVIKKHYMLSIYLSCLFNIYSKNYL